MYDVGFFVCLIDVMNDSIEGEVSQEGQQEVRAVEDTENQAPISDCSQSLDQSYNFNLKCIKRVKV
jgi:hypothetical protein